MIVDAHAHICDLWYEPSEALLAQMDRAGVDRAMLTQLLGQFDNRYQQACIRRWPDRFWSIAGIDPTLPDAVEEIGRLVADGAAGIRLRPEARSPGDDPLALWHAAARAGFVVSCVGTMAQFAAPAFAELLAAVPGLRVMLEHGAGLGRPDAIEDAGVIEALEALLRSPAVFVKLPGLGQLEQRAMRFPPDGARPFVGGAGLARLRRLVDAVPSERLMWGSDFPVVSSREGYANALGWMREAMIDRGAAEGAAMFGGSAARLLDATTS